ncbi:MAG: LytR family transcriptional regulator, partial [Cyanobium sp.]
MPDLLARRQSSPPPRRRRRAAVLPFALGLSLGYGLASPGARHLPSLLAALLQAPRSLAAIVNPMAAGQRRVLVLGRDNVGDNTDVMF